MAGGRGATGWAGVIGRRGLRAGGGQVLKKHLNAVAHVMVVGSRRKFLACLLTIKTLVRLLHVLSLLPFHPPLAH